jgi:methylase of polypeptide subunit release factors
MDNSYLAKLDQDNIHVTTRPYLDKVNSHTTAYVVDIFGEEVTVLPGVMSPKYDWAGVYMIDYLPKDFSNLSVLELGPGSGLVSLFIGLRGAKSITALDINPVAVENTRINLKNHNIKNFEVMVSDVFSAVPGELYDRIVFNLPYHDSVPQNDLEKGVIDEDYGAMKNFFAEAKDYLTTDGLLYVGFSQSGKLDVFTEELNKNNLEIVDFEELNNWEKGDYKGEDFHYNCQVYTLRYKK